MADNQSKINYVVGETYEFTVNTIHSNFCELVDSCGFYVYLKHTHRLNLSKGQKVRCKVTANYQKRPKIELVDDEELEPKESRITQKTVADIAKSQNKEWNADDFVNVLLMNEVEDKTFDSECRQWIENMRRNGEDLEQVRDNCADFMEESDFLSLCNPTEREHYQQRLTQIIDNLGYYIKADKLLNDKKANDYIEHLLDKLEKTGYVYHPDENFNILSILFLSDSSLMEDNIPRLFEIIRKWPVEIWDKEPFKSALVKALSLYIDENIWTIGKLGDNSKLVRNLIQALSILYIIANNKDNADAQLPDERQLLSRLCVLSTYIDEFSNKELLSLAVSEMFSESYYRPRFELSDTIGQTIPFDLKRRSTALTTWPVRTDNCFISNRLQLVVSKDGIAIWSDSPKAKTVVPEQLHLWGNMQVYADRSMMPSLSGDITVNDSRHLWEAIERDLFVPAAGTGKPAKTVNTEELKNVYGVGDTVLITINRVDEDDEDDKGCNRAYCTIKGESKESGYIYGRDIVSYMHHIGLWMFQDMYGNALTFEAKIESEDRDGMFHFSMLDGIKDYVCSRYAYGDTIICSMGTARRASTGNYPSPGITKDGYSVSLSGTIGEDLQRGDIVIATYQGKANGNFHIYCTLKDRYDGYKVDLLRAFHNLMRGYAIHDNDAAKANDTDDDNQQVDTVDIDNTDRMLDVAYVKELIRIIDRMALLDADYVRSYNYIAFARVLCKMVDWTDRAEYYRGRLQLIEMLYDFAINDRVSASQLDMLQDSDSELFRGDTQMHEKFQQLRIISFMGSQPHDEELMRFRSSTQGLTRQIASLAMAYNILLENNMKPQANDVLNHVKNMLKLNGYESHLKVYGGGIESRTVEFKTSIVYPPANDSFPDINRQMHTILSVIAAFLNTDGGTLYIGVNDSGSGVGVYDDLCYEEFNGDKDKYQRYVLDAVALNWGNSVASFVSADWDHDDASGKDVLIITVQPYAKGVKIDDEWIYRNGSGNRHLTKEEFEEYNSLRQIRLSNSLHAITSQTVVTNKAEEAPVSEPKEDVPVKPKAKVSEEKVLTSSQRKNILEDYLEGFVPYEACFKFLPHSKFEKITDYDYDTGTELTLPVYEGDVNSGYLMLGYENGTIGKVPVREIMKFDDYRSYNRYSGSRLLFASIATDDDAIITVSEEDKAGHRSMVRADSIADIDKCRLPDCGERVYNEGMSNRVISYEIAPANGLPDIKNILNKDVRTLGFPLATLSSDIKEHLEKWGVRG